MTKRLVSAVFVFVVAIVGVGCASGGYLGPKPFPGPLGDVVAGNLGLTCPGDIFVGPPVNRCLRSIGGNAGRYSSSPMYQGGIGGRQLSSTDKMAIFCGLGGSGVAMVLKAGLERVIGAGLISATACQVAGTLLNNHSRGRNGDVIVTPPPSSRGSVRQGASRPSSSPTSNSSSTGGEWLVTNRTSKRAELWDGEQFIARIEPAQSVKVNAPENGYKAILLIPNRSGGLGQETAQIRTSTNFNGWDIVAPAVQ